jgi:hypothetical protein
MAKLGEIRSGYDRLGQFKPCQDGLSHVRSG